MSIAIRGNLPAMQAVSQNTINLWGSLQMQISPFTNVIAISGSAFHSWNNAEKQWISDQYK
jgi:hypothetical protein